MSEHQYFEDLLPFYATNQLSEAERAAVKTHLLMCEACRSDLDLWQTIGDTIRASSSAVVSPPYLVDRALAQVHTRLPLQRARCGCGAAGRKGECDPLSRTFNWCCRISHPVWTGPRSGNRTGTGNSYLFLEDFAGPFGACFQL